MFLLVCELSMALRRCAPCPMQCIFGVYRPITSIGLLFLAVLREGVSLMDGMI